jgi:hypothetical protein
MNRLHDGEDTQAARALMAAGALDAFSPASLAVDEADGRCLWQSLTSRSLMAAYFRGGHFERGRLPPEVLLWMHREVLRRRAGAEPGVLTVLPPLSEPGVRHDARRLSFTLHAGGADAQGEGQWLIVMQEAEDEAPIEVRIGDPACRGDRGAGLGKTL